MIAALFALAAAMVIGGCAAVIQGFPYVRLESGLAMVIAGSVAASSGVVVLGLGVVAAGLRRVERTAGRLSDPRASEHADPAPAPEGRPRLPPVLPPATVAMPPLAEPRVVEPFFEAERPRMEPAPLALEGGVAAVPPRTSAIEPELPIPGLPPIRPAIVPDSRPDPEPAPKRGRAPEDDLFAGPETTRAEDAAPALRPSLDASPEPEPAPKPEAMPEPKPERTVVGRYASGGNTYVMFEDGAIEAETPQGRFTFASLDELKAFVDGGGESGARGTA